uniref:EGF-like domain-containing protein n=1 Tax=Steinernema glaseri TaxID=37863 RepID=A0A1I7YDM3_9BILA
MCLHPDRICDSIIDCEDGEDEGPSCEEKMCRNDTCAHICYNRPDGCEEKMCRNDTCAHICYNRPDGFACACKEGYTLHPDGRNCVKQDPCAFGACSQLCERQGHSKYCYCASNFEMAADKFTCKSTVPDAPYLVFTNRHEIRMNSLRRSGRNSSSRGYFTLRNTIALDYFYEGPGELTLFWSDIAYDKIYKGKLRHGVITDVEPIVSFGIWTAEGIAVDWIGMNIYWVDSLLDEIKPRVSP